MRLLLDVHHSRLAAAQLRSRGHDVTAASDDQVLATLPDEDLLRAATSAGAALVTENARDLDRIARQWQAGGERHAGIVFTSPRRFRRADRAYPGNLVTALDRFLREPAPATSDWVHWLS